MQEATRIERDSMGSMSVPVDALWGASTQRAVENFPISGYRFSRPFLRALGLVKLCSARTNRDFGLLSAAKAEAIERAASELDEGDLDAHFVLDVFQTGSGTSTNTNANEVIAHRAAQLVPAVSVHPNDEVNLSQSSNDVIPTAMHVAAAMELKASLIPALGQLSRRLSEKALAFDTVIKIGRTHLQDATPIRLGQEFSGYAAQASHAAARALRAIAALRELPIGGTAVGTGLNAPEGFGAAVAALLSKETGIDFVEAENHFEAQGAKDAFVEASGLVRAVAVGLSKVANDIRHLASGPRCGIGEIVLPPTQPGSSIMPGKVNPVMCEMLMQVCAQAVGADAAVAQAALGLGSYELHVGMPVMAHNLLEAIRLLSNATVVFAERCVAGIEADSERAGALVERSLAMCTALVPEIGYDRAAALAGRAMESGRTIRELAIEEGILPSERISALLDPRSMT